MVIKYTVVYSPQNSHFYYLVIESPHSQVALQDTNVTFTCRGRGSHSIKTSDIEAVCMCVCVCEGVKWTDT